MQGKKVTFTVEQAMKPQRGRRSTTLHLVFNFGVRWV